MYYGLLIHSLSEGHCHSFFFFFLLTYKMVTMILSTIYLMKLLIGLRKRI